MGIFSFFKSKVLEQPEQSYSKNELPQPELSLTPVGENDKSLFNEKPDEVKTPFLPEIPEEVFIEKTPPKTVDNMNNPENNVSNNIDILYAYLEQNLEKQGYEDAMINPDMHNMNENIETIRYNLFIIISKVKTYYSNHIRTIEFHIESRGRNGMIDTVDELVSLKEAAQEEFNTVLEIEADAKINQGLGQSLIMSYKKGFRNGLAAISFDTILRK